MLNASKQSTSGLTGSRKTKAGRVGLKKKAKELRGLRREVRADWRELMLTLRLIIEELESR